MRTWSSVNQKGGVGKTTLLLHLSVAAMAAGRTVSVIDLDPQRSAEQWSELREERIGADEPTVVHGTPTNLDGMLAAARETDTDLALIDTPPAVDKSLVYAAAAADVVIVPTRSGVLDKLALKETLDYLKRIGALSKSIVVLNAPSTDKEAIADIEQVARKEFGVAMIARALEDHVDLSRSLREGKGVTEGPANRKSAKAVQEIYQQLCAFDQKLAKRR